MKKLLLLVAVAISIASCQSTTIPPFKTRRVVILENNTVSFVHVPTTMDSIYRTNDTVWVNLVTHRIDDLDSLTMMAVIK